VSISQSFTVKGGIIVCGSSTNDTTLYFTIIDGERAYFCFSSVELRYGGQMGSIIYVRGGTVRFDNVKMNKQNSSLWVNPLIDVNAIVSTVDVYILSTNITNCGYRSTESSLYLFKSGIVYSENTSTKIITVNIGGSSFLNDSFYLSSTSYSRGGICRFNGPTQSGLFIIFYIFIFIFEFIFI
jgi:hypothetical protein